MASVLTFVLATIAIASAAPVTSKCDKPTFGVELEYAGTESSGMRIKHVNEAPAANYEKLMSVIDGQSTGALEHEITVVAHPIDPARYAPRRLRTTRYTDTFNRTWTIAPEYVNNNGVYDGYEVVSPPLESQYELESLVDRLQSSGLVESGDRSGMHVHIDASCLLAAGEQALANLVLLHESVEPALRRLFGTSHYGGDANPFTKSIAATHPDLINALDKTPADQRNHAKLAEMFHRFDSAEQRHSVSHLGDLASSVGIDDSKVWKYHSLNLQHVLPLNKPDSSIAPISTVEFRAYDVPTTGWKASAAVDVCRAIVRRAIGMTNEGATASFVNMTSGAFSDDVSTAKATAAKALAMLHLDSASSTFSQLLNSISTKTESLEKSVAEKVNQWRHRRSTCSPACQNGGSCIADGKSMTCDCPSGYTGLSCETALVSPCLADPCHRLAICTPTGWEANDFTCACFPDYTGDGVNTCNLLPGAHAAATFNFENTQSTLHVTNPATKIVDGTVSLTFTTSSVDALIFQMFHSDSTNNDELTIAIADRRISVTFNAGGGPATATTIGAYNDGESHTLSFTYSSAAATGTLTVDSEVITVNRVGSLVAINTDGNLILGMNYVGCISNVVVAGTTLDLSDNAQEINIVFGCVSTFASLCLASPCSSGVCVASSSDPAGFECVCDVESGLTGQYCDQVFDDEVTMFGDGYIKAEGQGVRPRTSNTIKGMFLAQVSGTEQTILSQSDSLSGKFVTVTLSAAGLLQVTYDLGRGSATVSSTSAVNNGKFHSFAWARSLQSSTLYVDGVLQGSTTTPGTSVGLHVHNSPLWVGGLGGTNNNGLVGSLRNLIIDDMLIDFAEDTVGLTIVNVDYSEPSSSVGALSSAKSFATYATLKPGVESTLSFRARALSSGVVLYQGQDSSQSNPDKDFLKVSISAGGFVEFSFNNGGGDALITVTSISVLDNKFHRIVATRSGVNGALFVDGQVKTGKAPGGQVAVQATGPFTIGKTSGGGNAFVGCIENVIISGAFKTQQLDLSSPVSTDEYHTSCPLA